MALWKAFKDFCLQGPELGNARTYLGIVYAVPSSSPIEDKVILGLRARFAQWVEDCIGNVSEVNFVRGLLFHTNIALEASKTQPSTVDYLYKQETLELFASVLMEYSRCPKKCEDFHRKLLNFLRLEYSLLTSRPGSVTDDFVRQFSSFSWAQPEDGVVEGPFDNIFHFDQETMRNLALNTTAIVNILQQKFENVSGIRYLIAQLDSLEPLEPIYPMETDQEGILDIQEAGQVTTGNDEIGRSITNLQSHGSLYEGLVYDILNYLNQEILSLVGDLEKWKAGYERNQVFSERTVHIPIPGKVLELAQELGRIINTMILFFIKCENERSYCEHEVILNPTHTSNCDKWVHYYLTLRFERHLETLKSHCWKLLKITTIIIQHQLPMVLMKESWQWICVNILNYQNIICSDSVLLGNSAALKVRLIDEETVRNINTGRINPSSEYITTPRQIMIDEDSNGCSATAPGTSKGKKTKSTKTGAAAKSTWENIVTLNLNLSGSCTHTISKKIMIATPEAREKTPKARQRQPSTCSDKATTAVKYVTDCKVALLLVIEVPFYGEMKQIWTISSPTVVASHHSQQEKAWLTMAWNDAFPLSPSERSGFNVIPEVDSKQVLEMIRKTFETIGECKIRPPHLKFIKSKLESHSLGPYKISKQFLDNFWSWFYKSTLVISPDRHFHEAFQKGFLELFVDDNTCVKLLHQPDIPHGTFIARISAQDPGSITFIFKQIYMNKEVVISKMPPLEAYKQISVEKTANALQATLRGLHTDQQAACIFVYPNICKKDAFQKFYKFEEERRVREGGYVQPQTFLNHINGVNLAASMVTSDTPTSAVGGNWIEDHYLVDNGEIQRYGGSKTSKSSSWSMKSISKKFFRR